MFFIGKLLQKGKTIVDRSFHIYYKNFFQLTIRNVGLRISIIYYA
jgi:hypothetical protein